MRRYLVLVALIVALVSLPAHGAEKVHITHLSYASHSQSWHDFLNEMKQEFEKTHPGYAVDIMIEADPAEKFAVMMAGGNSPDVLDLTTTQAGPFIYKGDFVDLNPYVQRDGSVDLSAYPEVIVQGFTDHKGRLIAMPISIYPIVTWYNKDLLGSAGLTTPKQLGDGWTWDALREYGRKLTKDQDGDGANDIWGIDRIRYRSYIQVRQAGGFFYDREMLPTESRVTSEPVLTALEFLRKLVVDDVSTQPPGTPNQGDTYLWKGRAAVDVVDGPGIIGSLMKDVSFDWDITMQPMGPDNNASAIFPGGFEVSAHSKHTDAAWEWVKFIATREKSVQEFTRITGRLPAMKKVALDYDRYVPSLPDNWQVFFNQTLNSQNLLGAGIIPDGRITTTLNQQLGRIWSGEAPVKAAMEEADRQISQFFAEAEEGK